MEIYFLPDSDFEDFSENIAEYEKIWKEDGMRIIATWEELTELSFRESQINATVFRGKSHSHPLSLRDNIENERKKSVLVHELGHRLIYGRVNQPDFSSFENHKTLFLVLYDIFAELYGNDFADAAVEWDRNLTSLYGEVWDWALQFSKEERRAEFEKRIKRV